jgi:hypothetical protein
MKRDGWVTWLTVVLAMVLLYSLLLVVAGGVAGSLFDLLGFGPPASIDSPEVREYLRLPFMVLGAVMAGWSLLMLLIVRGPLKEGASWAPRFLLLALALWFVLDTGMSFVLGFPTHALFNVPFALALGIPLLALRRATRA